MERRTITVFDKSKELQKIEQNKCNEMIINDILNPLLRIIYALRESDNFNNIPGTDVGKKTGWDYYTSEFNNIYRAINCNLFLSEYQYREIYKTVQGIHSYTRKFSGPIMITSQALYLSSFCTASISWAGALSP